MLLQTAALSSFDSPQPAVAMSVEESAEDAYFKAQEEQEARRERELGATPPARSFGVGIASCFTGVWRTQRNCIQAVTRALCCCCCRAQTNSGMKMESASSTSSSLDGKADSLPPTQRWYSPLFRVCPCLIRCCGMRAPTAAASSSSAYTALDGSNGSTVAPATAADEQMHSVEIEMQPTDHAASASSSSSSSSSSTTLPAISSLPVLPSVEKQNRTVSVSIPAPTHEVANPTIFKREPEKPITNVATDSPLMIPIESHPNLASQLDQFYADLGDPTDDELTDDDIDEEIIDLDGSSSSDDPFDPLRRSSHRSLEDTPAARRKREAKLAEKKRKLAAERKAKELPKEMPIAMTFPQTPLQPQSSNIPSTSTQTPSRDHAASTTANNVSSSSSSAHTGPAPIAAASSPSTSVHPATSSAAASVESNPSLPAATPPIDQSETAASESQPQRSSSGKEDQSLITDTKSSVTGATTTDTQTHHDTHPPSSSSPLPKVDSNGEPRSQPERELESEPQPSTTESSSADPANSSLPADEDAALDEEIAALSPKADASDAPLDPEDINEEELMAELDALTD